VRASWEDWQRDGRVAVSKQCACALNIWGRSFLMLTAARKRTAPFYGDDHIAPPSVSFPLFYTLPLLLSEQFYPIRTIKIMKPALGNTLVTLYSGSAPHPVQHKCSLHVTNNRVTELSSFDEQSHCVAFPITLTQLPFKCIVIGLSKTCRSLVSKPWPDRHENKWVRWKG
jgi:hypothetical protein